MNDRTSQLAPCVTLGPSASQQWRDAPDHLAMVLARYRAASALVGSATSVAEFGCGEGIGATILADHGRRAYSGFDLDHEAIAAAKQTVTQTACRFYVTDVLELRTDSVRDVYHAIVALDVIEHLDLTEGSLLLATAATLLKPHGVLVIGTPSGRFAHLASPQSTAAHVVNYTPDALDAMMSGMFHVVQSFGMQDTSIHTGHPDARHYLLVAGIMPR
jgi:2-polyprenyl-3-methyl-5-hydroxy-6-metoxy-1,4-benzoquinol methylase